MDIPFFQTFLCSAFAACFAEFCTIPLDIAKVRLQLQKISPAAEGSNLPKYRGLLGTILTIARDEGLASLWNGIVPGLHRQFLYGGLRIGLYGPVKYFLVGSDVEEATLFQKILAAMLTGTCFYVNIKFVSGKAMGVLLPCQIGAIAIIVANPTDLVKVQLQAEGKSSGGVLSRYSGSLNAYLTIVKQEGLRALWTGLGPNIARNAIINAAELASYDQIKQTILKFPGFADGIFTHLLAGLGAGLFAVCIGSPVDVVKSRMMGDSTYRSTVDCFTKTLRYEGIFSFYKGFFPNFVRLGSWNVIMFLTFEQAKKFLIGVP